MKKALFLVGSLLVINSLACGSQDMVTGGEEPALVETETEALTLQNCTPLAASSVIASGNDGNPPANTLDDQLGTRWSNLGKGSWIDYDLGSNQTVSAAAIAWHQGNTRTNTFTLSTSLDGMTYTPVYTGTSSGTTTAAETYAFTARTARRLRITVNGNSLNEWASIAEARVCSGTTPPPSTVVWRGDFETGDRTQWSGTQMVSADRLQVVSSPMREGRYAMKVTVRQGDDPINSSGNRNELFRMTREPTGSEYYYKWSTMFATDFPSVKTWQLFAQWHHEGSSGSPPVEFYVNGEEIRLNIGGNPGTIVWRTPLVRGAWQDFIFHVKWSPNASVGFVELYHNGKLVLPKRYIATQYSGMLNYLKLGLYRNETVSQVGVLYHDGFTMAKQLSDVLP
ncbi:heparin lyase I family protein [Hyalangium rubrum]|uniref:Heparin lyase I family protein n=1 Tax=Hyalangium rubrum TaxID=3103134 RepID=A0ABU5HC05_9BACT|nr:heparin lyase I family protein [Hyalangium sp. s54d21]MDY7230368.1 heparin lyase I family protein [Hyalangium sp. s54d21]